MPTISKKQLLLVLVEWEVNLQHQQGLINSICDQIEPDTKKALVPPNGIA